MDRAVTTHWKCIVMSYGPLISEKIKQIVHVFLVLEKAVCHRRGAVIFREIEHISLEKGTSEHPAVLMFSA